MTTNFFFPQQRGNTALARARKHGHADIADLLVANGATEVSFRFVATFLFSNHFCNHMTRDFRSQNASVTSF